MVKGLEKSGKCGFDYHVVQTLDRVNLLCLATATLLRFT